MTYPLRTRVWFQRRPRPATRALAGRLLRLLVHVLVVRPLAYGLLRLRALHRERLPATGPAVIVANHNSHLDTLVLMSLLPLATLERVRPVAAADYFRRNRTLEFCATRLLRAILIRRNGIDPREGDPLVECRAALARGEILIFYPEGTRGAPGRLGKFKAGIGYLAARRPDVRLVPVYLNGTEQALPKGRLLPCRAACHAVVGRPLAPPTEAADVVRTLRACIVALEHEHHALPGVFPESPEARGAGAGE